MPINNKVTNAIELAKLKAQYNFDFDKRMNEPRKQTKMHILFYGSKGVGKSYTALNLPSPLKVLAFSYDGLTAPIVDSLSKRIPDIWERTMVFDIEYLDDPEVANDSAYLNYDYIKAVIASDKIKEFKPDIILHDRVDKLNVICEGRMRKNQMLPSIGTVDYSLWKERKAYLSYIHKISAENTLGVFYTNYYDDYSAVDFKDKAGNVIVKKEPQYVDIIKDNVPFVIEIEQWNDKDKHKTYTRATVSTSKNDLFMKTGDVIDLSNYKQLITKDRIRVLYPNMFKEEVKVEVNKPEPSEQIEKKPVETEQNEDDEESSFV